MLSETEDKPEQDLMSIPNVAWFLGDVSQNHVRNLIRDGHLESVLVGRRRMVTVESAKRVATRGTRHDKQAA